MTSAQDTRLEKLVSFLTDEENHPQERPNTGKPSEETLLAAPGKRVKLTTDANDNTQQNIPGSVPISMALDKTDPTSSEVPVTPVTLEDTSKIQKDILASATQAERNLINEAVKSALCLRTRRNTRLFHQPSTNQIPWMHLFTLHKPQKAKTRKWFHRLPPLLVTLLKKESPLFQ